MHILCVPRVTRAGQTRRLKEQMLLGIIGTVISLLLTGCGGTREPQFDVRGTVTFDGRPVPRGLVYFDPDIARGNDGVQGFAPIRDGLYDTRETGKGISGGAYSLRISGFDSERGESGKPVRLLFEYSIAVEFPRQATTRDFDVPLSAAAKGQPKIPSRVPL